MLTVLLVKTLVITGATDGMGRALALTYLGRGDRVAIIGRNAEKGRALLEQADAGERARFIQADLSLIGSNERVLEELKASYPAIDALVLCARHYRSTRLATTEGFEHTFAMFYLSRFLFCHGLRGALEQALRPVIVNVAGPGEPGGEIRWDDLQRERDYHGLDALEQSGKLNELLGVSFADRPDARRTRFVLIHPGVVSTSFSGDYDEAMAAQIATMQRTSKSIDEAIAPIVATIDAPPAEPLSAIKEGEPLPLEGPTFEPDAAARLDALTRRLLSSRAA